MSSLFGGLLEQIGGGNLEALSSQLGTDPGTTQKAAGAAIPLLMAALARNASKPEGATALHGALARDHDGSVLDNLSGFLASPDTKTGDGILGHVLGARRGSVEQGVAQAGGINPAAASKMLSILAPMVLGALGKQQRAQNLDAASLGKMLTNENSVAEKAAPGLGALTRLLDADGDGSITDDLTKLGRNALGGLFRG